MTLANLKDRLAATGNETDTDQAHGSLVPPDDRLRRWPTNLAPMIEAIAQFILRRDPVGDPLPDVVFVSADIRNMSADLKAIAMLCERAAAELADTAPAYGED